MAGVQFSTGHHYVEKSSVAQLASYHKVLGHATDRYPMHLNGMELLNTRTALFFYLSL